MRVEWKIMAGIGFFFFLAMGGYAYMTRLHEPIGVVALALAGLTAGMIAAYMFIWARKHDLRDQDRPDAEISEGAGELGFFPAKSIWPLWVGLTAAVIALGPVFGWWIFLIGVGMAIWSITGWVYEFYRGEYKH